MSRLTIRKTKGSVTIKSPEGTLTVVRDENKDLVFMQSVGVKDVKYVTSIQNVLKSRIAAEDRKRNVEKRFSKSATFLTGIAQKCSTFRGLSQKLLENA